MRRLPSIAAAVALSLLAGGCGQAHGSASASKGPSGASSASSSAPAPDGGATGTGAGGAPVAHSGANACAPHAHTLCITVADEGRTITVHVGASFTLELRAAGRSFSEPTQSGAKALQTLARSRSGAAAEAYYRALAPGTAVLRSAERPLCRRGPVACPLYIVLWQVRVRVVR